MFDALPSARLAISAWLLCSAGLLTSSLAAGIDNAGKETTGSKQATEQMQPLALPRGGSRARPSASHGPFQAFIQGNLRLTAIGDDFSESFDDINTLPNAGWVFNNLSEPQGDAGWFQGNPDEFPAHTGDVDSYIAVNYESAGLDPEATTSNWLISPEFAMENGTEIRFWTRTVEDSIGFEDRLQVRLSTAGSSIEVGESSMSVGDFSQLLLDINPGYSLNGYPRIWTEYVLVVAGLSQPTTGRVAFRYFVENSGPQGNNGEYIGIDSFSVTQPMENEIFSDRFE